MSILPVYLRIGKLFKYSPVNHYSKIEGSQGLPSSHFDSSILNLFNQKMSLILSTRTTSFLFIILLGVLIGVSWPPFKYPVIQSLFFIPILVVCEKVRKHRLGLITSFSLLVAYNFTWASAVLIWIYANSFLYGLLLILYYSATLTIAVLLPLLIARFLSLKYISTHLLVLAFVAIFECLQQFQYFGFPLLSIGNSLSTVPEIIQWYEYTGALGGTIWLFFISFTLFSYAKIRSRLRFIFSAVIVILIPILLSIIILFKNKKYYLNQGISYTIGALHTNIDVLSEKFDISPDLLFKRHWATISQSDITDSVEMIVLPETSLQRIILRGDILNNEFLQEIAFNLRNTHIRCLLVGCITAELDPRNSFMKKENLNRKSFLFYNSALLIGKQSTNKLVDKEILVPFEEYVPPILFSRDFYLNWFYDTVFNEFTRGMYSSKKITTDNGLLFDIFNCYEIYFPLFVGSKSKDGSNVIVVITEEGWYNKFNEYAGAQLSHLSRLRCIENRVYVVRASNKGMSSIINPLGHDLTFLSGNRNGLITAKIRYTDKSELTIFRKYGSKFIYLIIIFIVLIILVR